MDIKNLIEEFNKEQVKTDENKEIILSVRITRKKLEFMKKNKISATKFFNYFLDKIIEI